MSASDKENENCKEEKDTIYSKTSLEYLSNPEQLDNLLVVVTPKAWAALLCMIALFVIVILWSIFGSIPIKVEGKGIVMNQKGLLFNVQAKLAGTLQHIDVHPGEFVKQGELVAEISDPQEELKVKKARARAANLIQEIEEQIASEKAEFISDLVNKNGYVIQLEKDIESLQSDLEKKNELFKEGLISISVVREAEEKLATKKSNIDKTKEEISNLEFYIAHGHATDTLKSKQAELFKAVENKEILEMSLPYYKVYTPSQGKVLELLLNEGDQVEAGTPIVWMEYATLERSPYLIYGYFLIETGKRIVPGTQMQIELSTIDAQEFGYLIGKVKEVSQYAVSKEGLAKIIHNRALVDYLASETQAVIQVIVEPVLDPKTGDYLWTSGKHPPMKISTGTICNIQAIIERVRPIYYILPLGKLKNVRNE